MLDLLVALLSGVAGAYATAKEQLAKSMAGVAIAVALVPPLAVAGIGIGWANPDMIIGASLLYLTNLIGIMLAASLTFLVLGFAPVSRARNTLAMSLGLLVLISIPLGLSFHTLIQQNAIRTAINELAQLNPADGMLEVREVTMRDNKPIVRLIIRPEGAHRGEAGTGYRSGVFPGLRALGITAFCGSPRPARRAVQPQLHGVRSAPAGGMLRNRRAARSACSCNGACGPSPASSS